MRVQVDAGFGTFTALNRHIDPFPTMAHRYSFLPIALALIAAPSFAQVVVVTDEGGTQLNGTTVYVDGSADSETDLGFAFKTTSAIDQFVNLKRYEVSVLSGTTNYFCWDLCFLPADAGVHPVWFANSAVHLTAGQTFTGGHAYYGPEGVAGTSTFRYVWFSTSDENDSTWVDVVFNAQPVGISEAASVVRSFDVYPNPAVGSDVTLSYDLAEAPAGTRLAVYNMLGERTLTRTLGAAQGRSVLRVGDLSAGVWFVALESSGKALATRRLVVTR